MNEKSKSCKTDDSAGNGADVFDRLATDERGGGSGQQSNPGTDRSDRYGHVQQIRRVPCSWDRGTFRPDGTIEDPVGTTPVQGTQAIIAYLQTFPSVLDEIRIQSFDVTVAGQEAAIKWRLRFKTKTGNVFFVDGIGIVRINEQGKIQSDREYFDLAYFQSQLQQ